MLYSMTGYGRATVSQDDATITVEAKSVNSRFLDISVRMPQIFSQYEYEIRKLVPKYISRGKVSITVEITDSIKSRLWEMSLNEVMVDKYARIIEEIDSRIMPERTVVSLDRFLFMDDIFIRRLDESVVQSVGRMILSATESALKELKKSRRAEGKTLQKDIQKRVSNLKNLLRRLKRLHESTQPQRFRTLREEVKKLVEDLEIDPLRLSQEVALLASKADCTEEIVRLESHIRRIEEGLKSRKPVGSLLNFVLQECFREINTIGSKTDVAEISNIVIDLKEEIERIKEQVQNIE